MSYLSTLQNDMKEAMKAKDKIRLGTLRMLISQIKNTAIDSREDLTEDQELAVLMSAAKKRKESIEIYEKSNRSDLLEKEAAATLQAEEDAALAAAEFEKKAAAEQKENELVEKLASDKDTMAAIAVLKNIGVLDLLK